MIDEMNIKLVVSDDELNMIHPRSAWLVSVETKAKCWSVGTISS